MAAVLEVQKLPRISKITDDMTEKTKYAEWVELEHDPAPSPAWRHEPLRPAVVGQSKQTLKIVGKVAAKVGVGLGSLIVGGVTVGAVIVGGIAIGAGGIFLAIVGEAVHAVRSLSAPCRPAPEDRDLPGGWSNRKSQVTIINNVHINDHSN